MMMGVTARIVLERKEVQQVNHFVRLGFARSLDDLLRMALDKYLYELSLREIRQLVPQRTLTAEQVETELDEIRRVKREVLDEATSSAHRSTGV
jgi:hypothetical protein